MPPRFIFGGARNTWERSTDAWFYEILANVAVAMLCPRETPLGRRCCVRKIRVVATGRRNGSVSVGVLALTAVPELPELGPVLRIPAFGLLFRGQRTIAAAFAVGDGTCRAFSQLSSNRPSFEGGIQCGTFGAIYRSVRL